MLLSLSSRSEDIRMVFFFFFFFTFLGYPPHPLPPYNFKRERVPFSCPAMKCPRVLHYIYTGQTKTNRSNRRTAHRSTYCHTVLTHSLFFAMRKKGTLNNNFKRTGESGIIYA
jgi:hypothetical protein